MSYKYSKYFMWISVLIALIFTVTCKLQPFSSVRVKANPKVYFPLGSKSITEDEVFKKFENLVPKNARLYRYQSGQDDKLHYLMHYPLQTLELDISKYFDGGTSIDNASLSQNINRSIAIPNLQQNLEVPIDVSRINQELLTKFNTGNITPKVTILSGTLPSSSYPLPAVNVKFQGFKTIAFKDGAKLKLSLNSSTAHYAITAAEMKSNGRSRDAETISGQNIEFSLDGITINDTVSFQLTLNLTSGSGDIFLGTSLEGVIEKATGVTSDTDIDINLPAQSVPLTLPADFEKAKIAQGSLKFAVKLPDEWSGITIKEKMQMQQSGSNGFSIIPLDYQPLGIETSLAGKNLNKQPTLNYTPVFKVKLNNATYTKQDSLPATLALNIKKFEKITLKKPSNFTVEKRQPVPEDMKNWIKKIKFNKVSSTINLNNGLPTGNTIKIKLSSNCFQMPEQEREFPSGVSESTPVYQSGSNFNLDIEHLDKFDLKAQMILPDDDAATFTLYNIETGKNVEFSGAVHFNLDWEEITLKAKTNQTGSFPETSSQDLSALTSKLKIAGIKLEEIPMYFYAGSDLELPDSTAVTVQLTAKYHKPDNSSETKTLVNKNNIVTLKALPAGTFPSDNKKPFTGSMPDPTLEIKEGEAGSQTTWTKIMNEYPKDLQLSYNLSMNEITINGTKYKEYKEKYKNKNPKVSIDLVLDVPVGFKVDSETMPSLTELSGINMPDNDLFGRGSSNDKPFGVKQLSDGLRFKVGITLKNGLNGASVVPKFVLQFKDGDGNSIKNAVGNPIEKTVTVAGEQALTFTATELDELLKKYPVKPELYLKLPSGDYSLRRDFELGASLSALVEADIDYTTKVK